MNFKNIIAAALAIAVLGASFGAHAYEDGDFQIWHTQAQDFSFGKKAHVTMEEEFRYGGDASQFYYQHYQAGLAYDVNKYLGVEADYRQIWDLKNGKFEPEYRPHLNATIKLAAYGFKLSDRNRLEFRYFDDRSTGLRYRNKLTLKYPLTLGGFGFEPYVADEIFADLEGVIIRTNRLYAGMGLDLVKHLKGEVYYLLQSSKKSGKWTNANVLGLKLKLSF